MKQRHRMRRKVQAMGDHWFERSMERLMDGFAEFVMKLRAVADTAFQVAMTVSGEIADEAKKQDAQAIANHQYLPGGAEGGHAAAVAGVVRVVRQE